MSGAFPTKKMDETKRKKKTQRRESKRPSKIIKKRSGSIASEFTSAVATKATDDDRYPSLQGTTLVIRGRGATRGGELLPALDDDYMSSGEITVANTDDCISLASAPITENTYSERRKRNRRKKRKSVERRRSTLEQQLRRVNAEQGADLGTSQREIDMDSASATYWKEKYRALEEEMASLRVSHTKLNLELGLTEEELKLTREDLEDVETECIDLQLDLEEVEQVRSRLEKRNSRLRKHMSIVEKENNALQTQIVKLSGNESGLFPAFEEEEDEDTDFGEQDTFEIDDDTHRSHYSTRTSDQESEENTTKGLWASFVDEMTFSTNIASNLSQPRRSLMTPQQRSETSDNRQKRVSAPQISAPPLVSFFRNWSKAVVEEEVEVDDRGSFATRLSLLTGVSE